MEDAIMYVVKLLISLADKHQWLSITLMVIGCLYVFLTALRGFLTGIVKITKTKVDDKVIGTIFAILDKFSYGFGALAEYYEKHIQPKGKSDK